MSEGISREVGDFIARHIVSVEQLEVLLLLRRTHPRAWSAEQVSDELRSSPRSASLRLEDLAGRGLVEQEGEQFRYRPGEDAAVAELEAAYAERRFTVIDLIFSRPADPLRVFADAFRLRREEDDG